MTTRSNLIALGACGTAALAFGWITMGRAQLGPLDPPAGPIMETSPSLADLEAKIDAISPLGVSGVPENGWNTIVIAPGDANADMRTPFEVASGRVLVHRIVTHRAACVVFDGPGGSINGSGDPLTGTAIGFDNNFFTFVGGQGGAWGVTTGSTVDVVAENGLFVAYETYDSHGVIQVLYKVLGP